jgi:hypothetical protein
MRWPRLCNPVTTAGVCVLLVCLVGLLQWRRQPDPGREELPEVSPVLSGEDLRTQQLDEKYQGVLQRVEAKRVITRELADGRLTLLQAAARIRDIDQQSPDFDLERFRSYYLGSSDDERHCRELIERFRSSQPPGPQTEALARRYEDEMHELAHHGTLRLPGPDKNNGLQIPVSTLAPVRRATSR